MSQTPRPRDRHVFVLAVSGVGRPAGKSSTMPRDSRALTRAARARMAATGETYTQARAGILTPRMDRDSAHGVTAALAFAELMAAGGRAARAVGDGGLPAAVAAVRAAVLPLWPRTVPEAARDVLVACAGLAVTRHVVAVPDELGELGESLTGGSLIASAMLELTAEWDADERPPPASGRFTPPVAYASSCAFDRDEDATVLDAVCVLLTLAQPAGDVASPEDWDADYGTCPECGGDDPQGTYGCSCFDSAACSECGDNTGRCECWV
jgi:hypothetical protein